MQFSWDDLAASSERLRMSTARLKTKRLKLPLPGSFFRVNRLLVLTVLQQLNAAPFSGIPARCEPNDLMLLVYVNMKPGYCRPEMIDPVELTFLNMDGTLVTTGTRNAVEATFGFEPL